METSAKIDNANSKQVLYMYCKCEVELFRLTEMIRYVYLQCLKNVEYLFTVTGIPVLQTLDMRALFHLSSLCIAWTFRNIPDSSINDPCSFQQSDCGNHSPFLLSSKHTVAIFQAFLPDVHSFLDQSYLKVVKEFNYSNIFFLFQHCCCAIDQVLRRKNKQEAKSKNSRSGWLWLAESTSSCFQRSAGIIILESKRRPSG